LKKRKKNLILLICVLAVMAVVFAVIMSTQKSFEEENDLPEMIQVYSHSPDQLAYIEWDWGDVHLSATRENEDNIWAFTEYPDIKASTAAIVGASNQIIQLQAYASIEAGEDLSAYGLDPARVSITLRLYDGTTSSLRIGLDSPAAGGSYCMVDGDDTIYIVSVEIAKAFEKEFIDFISQDTIMIFEDAELMTASVGNVSVSYERTSEPGAEEETWQAVYSDGSVEPVDSVTANTLIDEISQLQWTKAVAYLPTDEELEAFGLLDPLMKVSFVFSHYEDDGTYESQEFTVHVGQNADEYDDYDAELDFTYMTLSDSNLVYIVDREIANSLSTFFYSLKK